MAVTSSITLDLRIHCRKKDQKSFWAQTSTYSSYHRLLRCCIRWFKQLEKHVDFKWHLYTLSRQSYLKNDSAITAFLHQKKKRTQTKDEKLSRLKVLSKLVRTIQIIKAQQKLIRLLVQKISRYSWRCQRKELWSLVKRLILLCSSGCKKVTFKSITRHLKS